MPPKNNITLGPGAMYFNIPEGLQPLGEVQEIEITEEEPTPDILGNAPRIICPEAGEFTAELTLSPEAYKNYMAAVSAAQIITRVIELWKSYPNGRVKHLALYAKKRRTRKKNMRRLARELLRRYK